MRRIDFLHVFNNLNNITRGLIEFFACVFSTCHEYWLDWLFHIYWPSLAKERRKWFTRKRHNRTRYKNRSLFSGTFYWEIEKNRKKFYIRRISCNVPLFKWMLLKVAGVEREFCEYFNSRINLNSVTFLLILQKRCHQHVFCFKLFKVQLKVSRGSFLSIHLRYIRKFLCLFSLL